jgi:hypothetical protein
MNIIKILNPSLDEYTERANAIARRNNRVSFLMLNENDVELETDRNEFSFIMKAVGDQLLHREWEAFASKPNIDISATVEPELVSGSSVLGRLAFDCTRLCAAY